MICETAQSAARVDRLVRPRIRTSKQIAKPRHLAPRIDRSPGGSSSFVKDDHLPPLALEMVGDEGEGGVVAGLGVGLVAGDDDGEIFFRGEPGDGEPHGVAAGMGEGGAARPGLVVGDDPAHGVFRFAGGRRRGRVELFERFGFDQFGFGRREVGQAAGS